MAKAPSVNPVAQFEYELRKVIRRASRSSEYETAIQEFAGHFADIYQEEAEKDVSQAESKARQRIGNLHSIALQIVNTPSRVTKGKRLQALALGLYALVIVKYLFATFMMITPETSPLLVKLVVVSEVVFIVSGVLFGFGILLAKKLLWKPLVATTLFVFVGGGFALNHLAKPERYFKVSQEKAKALATKHQAMEPEIVKDEARVMAALNRAANTKPGVFEKDVAALTAALQAKPSEFFKIDSDSQGQYLYPLKIEYPQDPTYFYRVTLKRTSNLAVAQKQWGPLVVMNGQIGMAMRMRSENYQSFRNFAGMKPNPWTLGFNLSALLAAMTSGAMLMLAAFGYMLGRIRILGFDWFRLSKS